MKETTMLPLGSIIILKGNTKKMMIISRVIAVPVKGNIFQRNYQKDAHHCSYDCSTS